MPVKNSKKKVQKKKAPKKTASIKTGKVAKKKKTTKSAKNTKVKSTKKKISPNIKKDIKQAIEHIPKLIIEKSAQVKKDVESADEIPTKVREIKKKYYSKEDKKKEFLLWSGVIIVTFAIFIMWTFSSKALLENTGNNRNEMAETFVDSKDKFVGLISKTNEDIKGKVNGEAIEAALGQKVNSGDGQDNTFKTAISNMDKLINSIIKITSTTEDLFTSSTDLLVTSTEKITTSTQN